MTDDKVNQLTRDIEELTAIVTNLKDQFLDWKLEEAKRQGAQEADKRRLEATIKRTEELEETLNTLVKKIDRVTWMIGGGLLLFVLLNEGLGLSAIKLFLTGG